MKIPKKRLRSYWKSYAQRLRRCHLFAICLIVISFCAGHITHSTLAAAQTKISYGGLAANLPRWAVSAPKDCFVGISEPSHSIKKARRQALNSALSQILQTMGAAFSLKHESLLTGDHTYSEHKLSERLTYTANWFLKSIQQNIKEYKFIKHPKGYLGFVLIKVTPPQLQLFRNLTIGPQIAAKCIKTNAEAMLIDVKELNGVGVTLTGYTVSALTKNHHAGLITLFAWKVPKGNRQNYQGGFDKKLHLKKSSTTVTIYLHSKNHRLKSLILGAKTITKIILTGYDEAGRHITVPVIICP